MPDMAVSGVRRSCAVSYTHLAALATITSGGSTKYVFGDSIAEKAAAAGEGDQITVKKGSIDLTNVPDGVIVSNSGGGNVSVNGDVVKENPVTTHTHTYGNPVWTWTEMCIRDRYWALRW